MQTRAIAAKPIDLVDTLGALRQAFDRSFAEPASIVENEGELVLAIRAGPENLVVRLSEIVGLHECRKIVPLPGAKSWCLGLMGLRGRFHGVYRLSMLLGAPPMQTRTPWLLVAPGREAPAFAVEAIDGCLEINQGELHSLDHDANVSKHVQGLFVRDGIARGLLNMPSLIAMVSGGARIDRDDASKRKRDGSEVE